MFPPVQATMSTLMAWEKAGVSSFYSHNSSMLATTRQELTGQRRIGAIQRLFAGIKHEIYMIAAEEAGAVNRRMTQVHSLFNPSWSGDGLAAFVAGIGHRYDKKRAASSDRGLCMSCLRSNVVLRREPLHEKYHASAMCQAGQRNCLRAVCLLAPRFLSRARSPGTVGTLLECVLWPLH